MINGTGHVGNSKMSMNNVWVEFPLNYPIISQATSYSCFFYLNSLLTWLTLCQYLNDGPTTYQIPVHLTLCLLMSHLSTLSYKSLSRSLLEVKVQSIIPLTKKCGFQTKKEELQLLTWLKDLESSSRRALTDASCLAAIKSSCLFRISSASTCRL